MIWYFLGCIMFPPFNTNLMYSSDPPLLFPTFIPIIYFSLFGHYHIHILLLRDLDSQ